MKAQLKIQQMIGFTLAVTGILLGFGSVSAHATKLEAGLDFPSVVGSMAQNFRSNLGASIAFYPEPMFDPQINNFLSVGYASFTVLADQTTSYRIFPVLAGIELPGRVFSDLQSTFSIAAGGAFAYLNVVSAPSNAIRVTGFFAAQLKPGLLWEVSPDVGIYTRLPVTFLLGSRSLTYLAYSIGAQIKL